MFTIYWILKIVITPQSLLYAKGITLLLSAAAFDYYVTLLHKNDFLLYFLNGVIVSGTTSLIVTVTIYTLSLDLNALCKHLPHPLYDE